MSCESQFIKSLKISDKKLNENWSKQNTHFHNNATSKSEPTKESRIIGKINSIDLFYFLRACGSNIGWIS